MPKFVFPSQRSGFQVLPKDLQRIPEILRGLLGREREWLLGESKESPNLFFNRGEVSHVNVPLDIEEVLWFMHNHPTGRRVPSTRDFISARGMSAEEMGIVDPIKKRLLSIHDPNQFSNIRTSSEYRKYPFQFAPFSSDKFWKFPLPLIQAFRDPMIKRIVNSENASIEDIPVAQHALFKNWIQLLKD